MSTNVDVWLTQQDYGRLKALLAQRMHAQSDASRELEALEDILDNARVVQSTDVPANVVTMNSRVRYRDLASNDEATLTIVYPAEAEASAGRVSVLSPMGGALLGEAEGSEVELPLPQGQTRRIRIVDVLYQPEAEGNYSL